MNHHHCGAVECLI